MGELGLERCIGFWWNRFIICKRDTKAFVLAIGLPSRPKLLTIVSGQALVDEIKTPDSMLKSLSKM